MLSRRLKIGAAGLAILFFAAGVVVFQPRWFMAVLAKLSPDVVCFVETENLAVALSIDGGARGERTFEVPGAILPELKRRGQCVVTLSELRSIAGLRRAG